MRALLNILLAMMVTVSCLGAPVQLAEALPVDATSQQAKKQTVPPPPAKAKDVKPEVPQPHDKARSNDKTTEKPAENKAENKVENKAEKPAAQQGNVTKVTTVDMSYDGIDVSRHQKTIDWDVIAADKKVKYVYVKATEGQTFTDPNFRQNLENARRVGIKVGSYHFLRTGSSIQSQFENFTRAVKKNEQDLLPLLDVEVRQGWSNQQLRDSVKLFCDLLENHYGCKPMIYTSSSFFNNILGRLFADYPLFIARYAANEPRLDNGANWTLWQFSDKGRMRGIDHAVDLSRFNKGCTIKDILMKDSKMSHQKRRNADVVDKSREKPAAVNVKKEAPAMSKAQEKELKKKQEKERKERERAEKLAQEEAKKREAQAQKEQREREQQEAKARAVRKRVTNSISDAEAAKLAREKAKELEKEAKEREKAEKQAAKERERAEKQAAKEREREEKEAQKKVDKLVKEEIKKQEKAEEEAAKEEARQKAIAEKRAQAQAKAQAELEAEAQAEAAKKAKQQQRQEQKSKLQRQKAASDTCKTQSTATPTRKRTNKSSADND